MAFTGLVASDYVDGRTCHKTFGLNLLSDHNDEATSAITRESTAGRTIIDATAIIIDEVGQLDKRYVLAMDRKCRELMSCDEPWGGKLCVLGGDFRQCTPIIKGGNRTITEEMSIRNVPFWRAVDKVELTHAFRDGDDEHWSRFVDSVGDGLAVDVPPEVPPVIPLPAWATPSLPLT
jgi:hypothetical protein